VKKLSLITQVKGVSLCPWFWK